MAGKSVYKIRDTSTGLFLNKSGYWGKTGKVFTNIGHVILSLYGRKVTPSWQVVEYELVETEKSIASALTMKETNKAKLNVKKEERRKEYAKRY